jgi:hypothetical protein
LEKVMLNNPRFVAIDRAFGWRYVEERLATALARHHDAVLSTHVAVGPLEELD